MITSITITSIERTRRPMASPADRRGAFAPIG